MDWFPDWSAGTVAILASGPSGTREEVEKVRGWARVIAINCAWQFAPWADALYACDGKWWRCDLPTYGQHALREFGGLKVSQDAEFCASEPRVRHVKSERVLDLVTEPGVIGTGNNSGFQALNLAVQFGARRVLLLGYDMHADKGLHSHPDHPARMGNPDIYSFGRFMSAFNAAEAVLRRMGVEVINCTPNSRLMAFPRMSVDAALEETGEWQPST